MSPDELRRRAADAGVTFASVDGIVEWYENGREGIEQGFTIVEPPPGEGRLRVEGILGGGLHPRMDAETKAIDFLNEDGVRVLRYSEYATAFNSHREVAGIHIENPIHAGQRQDDLRTRRVGHRPPAHARIAALRHDPEDERARDSLAETAD